MRTLTAVLFAVLAVAPAAPAAPDLPVRPRSGGEAPSRAWRPDAVEVRLAPREARAAWAARARAARLGLFAVERTGVGPLDAFAAAYGARLEPMFRGEPHPDRSDAPELAAFWRVHLPEDVPLAAALATLRATPGVASAAPIAWLPVSAVPNDSLWGLSTWFYQPSRRDVHAPEAWDVTTGDTSVVIAILDTGVSPWHPDLAGTAAGERGNLWTNWAEAAGAAGVDDDGNGFVDDVAGWDFVALSSPTNVTPGEDWRDADNDPSDVAGHGTKVAGIAGALTDNARGVAGTAWRTRLMPLRVAWSEVGRPLGIVDMSYAAEAIRYAQRNGASVVNCSFETADEGGLLAAARAAMRAGVTIVNAAGNGTPFTALAEMDEVIAVAATDANDAVAGFSNTGPYVDLAAPGVDVAGPFVVAAGPDSIGVRTPSYDRAFDGTSFAAPIVAGAAALLQSQARAAGGPPLDPREVQLRLFDTADDIAAQNPSASGYGAGRLNLARALGDPPTSAVLPGAARTVGPPVVLPTRSGAPRVAHVTSNARLVIVAAANRETLAHVALPGGPARMLAAADVGGGRGVMLAVGTINGRLAAFDAAGAPWPGFPVSVGSTFVRLDAGPAFGDLDGDGVREVVCGSDDGALWAWDANGDPVPGFPVEGLGPGWSGPVALADLDGAPGDEIVALALDGVAHALRADGAPLPGWPVALGGLPAAAPTVAAFADGGAPHVIAPSAATVHVLAANGAPRFAAALSAPVVHEAPVADLDGDGVREIVALASAFMNHTLATFDSSGTPRTGAGWPLALGAAPLGPPVVGPLRAGGAPGVLLMRSGGLAAWTDSARAIRGFPKPGGAGAFPALAELDGDARTEVVAGTGPDSALYLYDAGAGTWGAPGGWPEYRGNAARTGSAIAPPALPPLDDVAPAAIADLAVDSIAADAIALRWTAPGDDGAAGRAAAYQLHASAVREAAGSFAGAGLYDVAAPPDTAGAPQRAVLAGLAPGTAYAIAVRARDAAGNWAPASNVVWVTTPLGPARLAPPGVPAVRPVEAPSRAPVALRWQGAAAARGREQWLRVHDAAGRLVHSIAVGRDTAGTAQWNGRDRTGRPVPAGVYFVRLASGSFHAETRVVLLP